MLTAPIFYFEGSLDPNTPLEGALNHIEANQNTNRFLIQVYGGSHGALSVGLSACKRAIINEIQENQSISAHSFKGCLLQTRITSYLKGQKVKESDPNFLRLKHFMDSY